MEKWKMSDKWKKVILILGQQVLAVVMVLNLFMVLMDSIITIHEFNREKSYMVAPHYFRKEFENTDVFSKLFQTSVDDIVRMAVIKNQLETDGELDSGKQISISDYVNRKNEVKDNSVTAVFYLGDLIKWYSYGISSEWKHFDTAVEADAYFDKQQKSSNDTKKMQINVSQGEDATSINITELTEEDVMMDEEVSEGVDIEVIHCRYQTIDGQTLEEIASSVAEYKLLVENLRSTLRSLGYNYEEYKQFQELYEEGNSNIYYCIELNQDGEREVLSNIQELEGRTSYQWDYVQEVFEEYESRLYYDPYDIFYETNIDIEEYYLFDALRQYDYAYPEDTKVWIGVDTSYSANDRFTQGKEAFDKAAINIWRILASLLCFLAYMVILVVLTIQAGRRKNEEGQVSIHLQLFDHLHTEIAIIFGAAMTGLWWCLYFWLGKGVRAVSNWKDGEIMYPLLFAGFMTFFGNAIFLLLYYSLVRRIKGHNLWKESFAYSFCQGLKKMLISLKNSYNHMNVVMKSWLPYMCFLLGNFFGLVVVYIIMVLYEHSTIGTGIFFFLVGFDLWIGYVRFTNYTEWNRIVDGLNQIREGDMSYQLDTEQMHGENRMIAEVVNNIGDGIRSAVEVSMKDERLKADLITNVSHDIKTPLTSIINYVDLLKREKIENAKIEGYIQVLDAKSQRLKQLTEDLVEASKISSGNISLVLEPINLIELLEQAKGEFSERFEAKELTVISNYSNPVMMIEADSRQIWRVIENLFQNIAKYALEGTRVYLNADIEKVDEHHRKTVVAIKNISKQSLNIQAEELTERFVRGDVSRSSEGSGLGLSIAKNLMKAHHGTFEIYLDGDLFKVTLTFPSEDTQEES